MNILYHHRTRGGEDGAEGAHIREVINAFRGLGHSVDIMAPPGVTVSESSGQKEGIFYKSLWHLIRNGIPQAVFEIFEILYNLYAYFRLRKYIHNKKYDLIYERYSLYCIAGMWCARKNKIPFILEVNYTSITRHCRLPSRLLSGLQKIFDGIVLRGASGISVVSAYLKNHLMEDFRIPGGKIIVLPNAADPTVFYPDISGDSVRSKYQLEGKTVIGFVGSFLKWHGLNKLIEVFPDLKKTHGEASLLLVGDGETRASIESMAAGLGFRDEIVFTGRIPHDQLPQYIAAFDIAVLPNSNEIGSPMKIFEYMSMGKPVVAPSVGPVAEVMENGVQGILFAPGDYSAMKQGLRILLEDRASRVKYGLNGRATVLEKYSWKENVEKVIGLYDIVKNPKQSNPEERSA